MARLFVSELYRTQHAIIKRAWETDIDENGELAFPTVDELTKITCKPRAKILRATGFLREKELVKHDQVLDQILTKPKAELVYLKEELLDEGWEKFMADMLRWAQIFGIISGSLIALATFIINTKTTISNKMAIESLQREVRSLEQRPAPVKPLPAKSSMVQPTLKSNAK